MIDSIIKALFADIFALGLVVLVLLFGHAVPMWMWFVLIFQFMVSVYIVLMALYSVHLKAKGTMLFGIHWPPLTRGATAYEWQIGRTYGHIIHLDGEQWRWKPWRRFKIFREPERDRCPDCKNEIDPDWCHCGDSKEAHAFDHGHPFVPMGCDCLRNVK